MRPMHWTSCRSRMSSLAFEGLHHLCMCLEGSYAQRHCHDAQGHTHRKPAQPLLPHRNLLKDVSCHPACGISPATAGFACSSSHPSNGRNAPSWQPHPCMHILSSFSACSSRTMSHRKAGFAWCNMRTTACEAETWRACQRLPEALLHGMRTIAH